LSGVKKEMSFALIPQITTAGVGFALWVASRFL
jgi:hypothetical protein